MGTLRRGGSEDLSRAPIIRRRAATGLLDAAAQLLGGPFDEGRDMDEVTRRFPNLEIVERRPLRNWLRYILSGGVNFRTLAPGWSDPILRAVEAALSPLAHWLAIHHLIVLRKTRTGAR